MVEESDGERSEVSLGGEVEPTGSLVDDVIASLSSVQDASPEDQVDTYQQAEGRLREVLRSSDGD